MKNYQEEDRENIEKVLSYAHRLISIRLRTERELRMRLRMRKFAPEAIDRVIEILDEEGLLNDEEFAREYLESKLRALWHPRIIYFELLKRGVSEEIARRVTGEVDLEELRKEVKEKALSLNERNASLPPEKRRRRLYSYFMRRGFSKEFLNEILP